MEGWGYLKDGVCVSVWFRSYPVLERGLKNGWWKFGESGETGRDYPVTNGRSGGGVSGIIRGIVVIIVGIGNGLSGKITGEGCLV